MTEVELKAALTPAQAQALPRQLAEAGFLLKEALQESDVYFNGSNRDFRKTDEALRLRAARDLRTGAETAQMTYKGAKIDERSNSRTEYETTVAPAKTARQVLEALGFTAVFTVEKQRRAFCSGDVTACLDEVTGLGCFIELEILLESGDRDTAVDQLLSLLDQLSISRQALRRQSYLELMMAAATEKKSS